MTALVGVASVVTLTLLVSSSAPADPSAALAPESVSAGGTHTCAIRTDGTIACWGDDSAGQLDEIPSGRFRAISAGGAHSCAIHDDGALACWGDDSAGQLDGIPGGEFRQVSAGGAHSCAIRADGTLACWGDDSFGQVDGAPTEEPVVVPYHLHKHHNDHHHHHYKDDPPEAEVATFASVAAGERHTCAVEDGGELECWGDDSAGHLDEVPLGAFLSVSAGGAHSCAIGAGGALACWGDDSAGQLDEVPLGAFLSVSAGGGHSCAVSASGEAACWGANALWQSQPELTGPEPPPGVTGTPYSHAFATTPQSPGAIFSVIGGSPPPGLTLAADGTLAGTPTVAGTFVFTVAAANGVTPDATREVTVKVTSPPPPPAPAVAAVETGLPDPTAGVNFNLEPIDGVSRVRCGGESGFSVLTDPKQVPISCQVDTRHGVVRMTTANGEGAGTQSALFWGGAYEVSQKPEDEWLTRLHLAGRLKCEKRKLRRGGARPSKRRAKRKRRRSGRKLWGSGKGRFKTSGNYGSATVRGTVWLVRDRCDGSTLFKVRQGIVTIQDFVKDRTLTIGPGKRYVARSAIPRLR